jgi:primosomal protein N' (replication factor Y)
MRCGHKELEWKCQWCGSRSVRSTLVGDARTAEELGRAFPGVPVRTSGKNAVLESVPNEPALVIATPGAEPVVEDGYFEAAVILDAEMSLRRIDLRAEEESFRRWQYVVSLVKPEAGRVVVVADESKPIMQALIRHDAIGFAERELQLRKSAQMPPAFGVIEVRCDEGMWLDAAQTLNLPPDARVLGPVLTKENNPKIPDERVLITFPRSIAPQVTKEIRLVIAKRTASKAKGKFHAKVDPIAL